MKKVVLNHLVIAALVVSAAFTSCDKDTFTVTFDSKGGSDVQTQTVEKGGKLTEPKDPTRSNYDFAGWATADNETSPLWDFVTGTVEADMTLYARWNAVGGNGGANIGKITATVEGGAKYNGQIVTVKFMIWDDESDDLVALVTGNWSNGGFTIELPQTLDAKFLFPLALFAEGIPWWKDNITVSNNNAKITLDFPEILGFDKDDEHVASFKNIKEDENSWTEVVYWYADIYVNISGSAIIPRNPPDDDWDEEYYYSEENIVYSLELKKGWNIVYFITSSYTVEVGKKGMYLEFTTETVDGLKWVDEW